MQRPVLATLDPRGWTVHPPEMLDSLMVIYINSEHSQADYAPNHVKSLKYDIANFNQNPMALESRVKDSMSVLFGAYFPEGCDVEVLVSATDPERPSVMDITTKVVVVADNVSYDLGHQIETISGKVSKYMKLQDK